VVATLAMGEIIFLYGNTSTAARRRVPGPYAALSPGLLVL
jgi:hypothetical protein